MDWPRLVMKTIAVLIVVSGLAARIWQLAAHPEWTEAEAFLALWPLWLAYVVLAGVYLLAVKVELDGVKPKTEEPKTWVRMESLWGRVTVSTAPSPDGPWTEPQDVPQDFEPPATTDVDIVTFTEE